MIQRIINWTCYYYITLIAPNMELISVSTLVAILFGIGIL